MANEKQKTYMYLSVLFCSVISHFSLFYCSTCNISTVFVIQGANKNCAGDCQTEICDCHRFCLILSPFPPLWASWKREGVMVNVLDSSHLLTFLPSFLLSYPFKSSDKRDERGFLVTLTNSVCFYVTDNFWNVQIFTRPSAKCQVCIRWQRFFKLSRHNVNIPGIIQPYIEKLNTL